MIEFQVSSAEGLPIRAALHAPSRAKCLVLVIHGFKGFKDWGMFPWLADSLAAFGFAVCRFDMSRSGVGEVPGEFGRLDLFAHDTYSIERSDLLTVINRLDEFDEFRKLPVFLLGHSRGGGVALLAANRIPRLRGIITWSSVSRALRWDAGTIEKWRRDGHFDVINTRTRQVMRMSTAVLDDIDKNRHDIAAAARRLNVPLLVLHGGSDETVPVAEGQMLARQAPDATLIVIEHGTHTFGAVHPFRGPTSELVLAAKLTRCFLSVQSLR